MWDELRNRQGPPRVDFPGQMQYRDGTALPSRARMDHLHVPRRKGLDVPHSQSDFAHCGCLENARAESDDVYFLGPQAIADGYVFEA